MTGSRTCRTPRLEPVAAAMVACVFLLSAAGLAVAQSRGLDALGAGRGALAEAGTPVDVELVLAVDISWSMSDAEQIIQREGYAAAFRSREVQDAIFDGVNGAIAVTYVEWAGQATQATVIPWTLIDSKESADGFAYRLAAGPPTRARRTSISGGIAYSAGLFDANGYDGLKRVIDISGDGPNNQGQTVDEARDAAVARGITINGLPLMTGDDGASWAAIDDLDRYYEACVIGGPGAFVVPVHDWPQFPAAVRRKLVLELALDWPIDTQDPRARSNAAPIVATKASGSVDCRIGETLWQQRQRFWMDEDVR
ncbi:DUF1194 domain-containing protein [Fulvimarina sp. 2208YS6-2-32]|uniref:DUF1194 domain-containing protein n=1 Tax=Fulvimarina uroteuthidis TaxID=3098149 RepID=A0ABU5I5I2_9HYPH|nr:DUF1194 domain-containing protein [Fulvimarina sp. 2208YS6-2-32]MDY8109988.1 DUF1194 domain-containing protein [Fulvimarina sp. 2208YS6-2-32]